MNNYLPTRKTLYLSIGAAAVGVAIFTLSIIALARSISLLKKESSSATTATLGLEAAFLIKKNLAALRPEIEMLDSFFVNAGGEVGFIEKLERVAQASAVGIEISSIATFPKKETGSDLVENLSLKVEFEGEWNAVVKFLKAVENMPYATAISSIETNLIGGALWKGKAEITALKMKN